MPDEPRPSAGQTRRATERAFHRHLDQQISAEQALAIGAVPDPVEKPIDLLADELTRRPVPNRRDQRRAARRR